MSAAGPWAAQAGSIPELAFAVRDAERMEYAAVPTLRFALGIESVDGRAIRSILLDVQIRIAARRRAYDAAATDRLFELFGPRENWGTSLNSLLWTRTTLVVPPFTESTVVDLPVVCTYDLEVSASRYLDALGDGEVPLEFLFSGSVFYGGADGRLQTARISWEHEAEYRLPVAVWKDTMDHHFPGSAWVRLPKESFDRLCAYRSRNALPSWDAVVDALVPGEEPGERGE
ncbi:MAG: hypothetical protein QOC64_98 [Solirubrobacteraceae bacterium]|jgi:hypothetical protein|nr:hypothetical protein [Solirubrobacteraceae bacterium]